MQSEPSDQGKRAVFAVFDALLAREAGRALTPKEREIIAAIDTHKDDKPAMMAELERITSN